jgi:hypothetical protein
MDFADDTTPESVVSALGGSLADSAGGVTVGAVAAARERSERLGALRRQRMLLAGLRDDVEFALRTFSAADDPRWISEAQRQYAGRRAELRHELTFASRALEEALAGVAEAIVRLEEAG